MCLKGKKLVPHEPGNFVCKKCGATSDKKGKLCKPEKIEADGSKDKKEKKKEK